jgi:hypothetical protein
VLALSGGKGIFSVLQEILQHKCDQGSRVCLTQPMHRVLQYFRWLTEDLTRQPQRISEITPKAKPDTMRAQDASALAIGGVHFVPHEDGHVLLLLWQSPFQRATQQCMVSFDNPTGDINKSKL